MASTANPQGSNSPNNFQQRGLHNWRNLFRKPNGYEIVIFIMLFLGILMALAYKSETQLCRDTLKNLNTTIACEMCSASLNAQQANSDLGIKYGNASKDLAKLLNNQGG